MIVAAEDGSTGITDEQVSANVLTMLLAGEDTTAHTLGWLLHLLHRHPSALARACDEARRVAVEQGELTPEHLAQLEFIEACIHETMRLKPVAPFTVVESLRETVVGDLLIPKGTLLWCALRHDSLDDAALPPGQRLRPGALARRRHLQQRQARGDALRLGPAHLPGPLPGADRNEDAAGDAVQHFDIHSVDTPDGREAAERMSFTMVPVGLTMRLRERSGAA